MPDRRTALVSATRLALMLAGLGRDARADARPGFEARTVADLMQALGAGTPVESPDVSVTAPDVAENGAVVPIGVATALPGVRRLLLLVEKNPGPLSAAFDVGDLVEPSFTTTVKMVQSSDVVAIALMADGRALLARKAVEVTVGGCGG